MPGFIRDDSDIRLLILYVLSRLPEPVPSDVLATLCLVDGNVTHLAVLHNLGELEGTGMVTREHGRYVATERGRQHCETVSATLPYPVRTKAERGCAEFRERAEHISSVRTSRELLRRGGYSVELGMTGDGVEIINLRLFAPNEQSAQRMEREFDERAAEIYGGILDLLTGSGQ